MLFDTHAHYDDDWFDADRDALLSSMPAHNVGLILNPGCTVETSETAIRLAETYDFMYAAVGIHPEYSMGVGQAEIDRIRALSAHPKVKAIGEIGLDYYWEKRSPETTPPREQQKQLLRAQLELARDVGLPVIIHDREAHEDCFNIVKEYAADIRGVYHCYSGSLEMAKEIIKLGWYISFTGVITYGKAKKARRIIEGLPMDRIMIETDSPYLTPEPERLAKGRVRNSSLFVHRVAEQIADFKGMTVQEVEDITTENGKRFFGIDKPTGESWKLMRTDAGNPHFQELVAMLDDAYYERFGALALKYRQYNVTDGIADAFVMYCDGEPAACGCFKRYDAESAELKRVFVRKEFRRKHLATEIVEVCECEARRQGYHAMVLETGAEMPEAIAMYQKLGYALVENYGDFTGDTACVCMRKQL